MTLRIYVLMHDQSIGLVHTRTVRICRYDLLTIQHSANSLSGLLLLL